MTVRELLAHSKKALEKQSEFPWLEAVDLLGLALSQSRERMLVLDPEKKISESAVKKTRKLVKKRQTGFPLPYLLGKQAFCGLDFLVTPNVMIPRPETETLIEEALKSLKGRTLIVDVGTGSGCIAVALAKFLKGRTLIATDISVKALKVAKKNAKLHGVAKHITFLQGNLLEPFFDVIASPDAVGTKQSRESTGSPQSAFGLPRDDIIILANLPYLTSKQLCANPDLSFEPRLALYGGPDGLNIYRRLFEQINQFLIHHSTFNIHLLLEIDPGQKESIKNAVLSLRPSAKISFSLDFHGLPRVACIFILP